MNAPFCRLNTFTRYPSLLFWTLYLCGLFAFFPWFGSCHRSGLLPGTTVVGCGYVCGLSAGALRTAPTYHYFILTNHTDGSHSSRLCLLATYALPFYVCPSSYSLRFTGSSTLPTPRFGVLFAVRAVRLHCLPSLLFYFFLPHFAVAFCSAIASFHVLPPLFSCSYVVPHPSLCVIPSQYFLKIFLFWFGLAVPTLMVWRHWCRPTPPPQLFGVVCVAVERLVILHRLLVCWGQEDRFRLVGPYIMTDGKRHRTERLRASFCQHFDMV